MPPPQLSEEPQEEEWLVTYADAITILMAFFVMLVSFSKIDLPMYEAVMAGISKEIGMGKDSAESITQQTVTAIESAAFEMSMEQEIEVQKDDKGVVIEMGSKSFFKPGTAQITSIGLQVISSWAKVLTTDQFKYFFVEVEGHTDDDPINTKMFPSNWELSAARAASVVRVLEKDKIQPFQLKVVGFGAAHPKVPNRDFDGNAIPVNQAKNRRIVVHLVQMIKSEKEALDQVLLEQRLAEEERIRAEQEKARQQAVQDALKATAGEGNATNATTPSKAQQTPIQPAEAPAAPAQ